MKRIAQILFIIVILCISGCVQRYYNLATQQEEVYFYSSEKEVRIGKSLSKQVERKFKLNNDLLVQQRINDIGQKIARVCDRKDIRYNFKVLSEEEVNAVALPGGFVYIFEELWKKVEEKDELIAAVLAHEVAHVSARHSIKRLQNSIGYGALAVLVNTASGMDSYSRRKATIGINQLLLSYSRSEELEADELAVTYLSRAGYKPGAIIEVLEILQQTQRERPIRQMRLPTHPYITDRMKVVKEQINMGTIGFDDYINTQGKSRE